jgi:5-methyltetrahydrofolate--homocysteine methyltransferase
VRRGAPHLPLWISITVVTSDAGLVTPHGVSFDRMLRALSQVSPDAVGVNCSLDAERIRPAVDKLVAAGIAPVFARPQARISEKCATGRSTETPGRFAAHAVRLFASGASAVGGCCGTHPGSIVALAEALRLAGNLQEVSQ